MAVTLSGGHGVFDLAGSLLAALNENNVQIGSTTTTRLGTVLGIGTAQTQINALSSIFSSIASYRTSTAGWQAAIQQMAQNMLLNMFNADASLVPNTITQALTKLIAQMVAQSVTVQKPGTLTGTVANGGSNVGDAVASVSVLADNGVALQQFVSETIVGTVSSDFSVQSTLALNEPVSLVGPPAATNPLNWDWPVGGGGPVDGSGTNTSIQIQNAATDGITTNGDFENWSSGTFPLPTGWTSVVGSNATIVKASSPVLTGSFSLEFVGNGSELTAVKQQVTLTPLTTYGFNLWVRASAAYTGGALAISLVDGSGTVINDAQTVANTITLGATAASNTGWTSVRGFFRTPQNPPAATYVQIALTSAIQSGRNLFFDRVKMATPTRLYGALSPAVVIYSGGTNSVRGDTFTFTLTNSWTSTTSGGFVFGFERLFNMRSQGLVLPSASSPTLSDGLIV